MVNTKKVEKHIAAIPHLHALTLTDDGSPAQDKTVSHINAITICKMFLGTRITKARVIYFVL